MNNIELLSVVIYIPNKYTLFNIYYDTIIFSILYEDSLKTFNSPLFF